MTVESVMIVAKIVENVMIKFPHCLSPKNLKLLLNLNLILSFLLLPYLEVEVFNLLIIDSGYFLNFILPVFQHYSPSNSDLNVSIALYRCYTII